MGIPSGPFYIDGLLTWTVNTHAVTTGASTDADSVPTYRIYEDETGTAIATGSMAKLDDANTVGFYSEQITLSAANGYEVGKCYSIYIASTVSGVSATKSENFNVIATPAAAMTAADIRAALGMASANLDTQLTAIDDAIDTEIAAILAAVDTEVAAIKTKTDFLPSVAAGAAGGVFIAGTNAATVITGSLTTTFTGNLTGSAGSVTGSVGTVNALAANAITAAATAADYVTEVQSGLATSAALATAQTSLNTIDARLDTEIPAIKAVTDKLDTTLVIDGAVYQYTANALELAPTGGGGATAAQIADAVWDEVTSGHVIAGTFGKLVADINAKTTNLPSDPADASDIAASFAAIELAVDNVDEIADAVWAVTSRTLTEIDEDNMSLDLNTTIQTAVAAQFDGIPTATENANELLDLASAVEYGLTVRQALRLISSVSFGKASGLDTTTAIYRDFQDIKDRITATVDVSGNRSSIVVDFT